VRHAIRRGFEISLALALVLVLASPVAAAKPDRSFAEAGDIVVSGYCDFDVIEHPLSNNEYFTTFFDGHGNVTRTHVAGRLVLELINVDSGDSIVINSSGPGRFVDDADGTTILSGGTWILNFAERFFILNGRGVFRVDGNGETIVALHGQVTDVCPLLAD
jgi:hypothetical protein